MHAVGQRLARYIHGDMDGEVDYGMRGGGVDGRGGEAKEGRDEIEGPPAEVLMHLRSVRPDGGALALDTMSS
ncbi:hypothetical protein VZT92_016392 [Zoarces viviparus]|uniref:Uncharacterized protein n=1 Tax=Zoarces viviparus TaxID=48416 RepID=A0AAW1ESM8_ZOAVI